MLQKTSFWRPAFEQELGASDDPARLYAVQAMDQSAAMADRFHRIFMRTLRALRDLRRYSPLVIVQNAGQVNVGGQQVNVGQSVEM